ERRLLTAARPRGPDRAPEPATAAWVGSASSADDERLVDAIAEKVVHRDHAGRDRAAHERDGEKTQHVEPAQVHDGAIGRLVLDAAIHPLAEPEQAIAVERHRPGARAE